MPDSKQGEQPRGACPLKRGRVSGQPPNNAYSLVTNMPFTCTCTVFSERELKFMFAICHRPSVCRLSVVCLSVCLSSVTFVRPTQTIEIFGNFSSPFGTLAICWHLGKILWRSSHGNPSVGELNRRGVAEYSDFGPIDGYISETVQDRRYVTINH